MSSNKAITAQIVTLPGGERIVGSFIPLDNRDPNSVTAELLEQYPGATVTRGTLKHGEQYLVNGYAAAQVQALLGLV